MKSRIKKLINEREAGNQSKFAKRVGVSSGTVSIWLKQEKANPSSEHLIKICNAYGVSANWLLMEKGHESLSYYQAPNRNDISFQIWIEIFNRFLAIVPNNLDLLIETYKKSFSEMVHQAIEECDFDKTEEHLANLISSIRTRLKDWESQCDSWIKKRWELHLPMEQDRYKNTDQKELTRVSTAESNLKIFTQEILTLEQSIRSSLDNLGKKNMKGRFLRRYSIPILNSMQ